MALRDFWRGEQRDQQRTRSDPSRRDENYGGSDNPFLGDHPLTRAGSAYESDYFAGNGIPSTRDRPPVYERLNELDFEGEPALWPANQAATGQHRGRGPRGYQRSDERIKEDVCQCLTDDHHIDATDVEVAVRDREVILTGTVSTRAQKRHAEDLIERLSGVRDVINSLRVDPKDSAVPTQQANWR